MTPNGLPDPQLTRLPTGDIMYTLHMPIGTLSRPATAHRRAPSVFADPLFHSAAREIRCEQAYADSCPATSGIPRAILLHTLRYTAAGYALLTLVRHPLTSTIFSCWRCALAMQTVCWRRWR